MSMAELVAAGAPELPDGWFYRVGEHFVGLAVEIREPRRHFGSVIRAEAWVRLDRHDDGQVAVIAACIKAYDSIKLQAEERAKFQSAAQFLGDHDPKGGR